MNQARIRPTAVIFDYGNVLSQSQHEADVQAMAAILDLPTATFRELYWRCRHAYDEASLDAPTYWHDLASAASRSLTSGQQLAALIENDSRSWSYPAPVVPEWARALHASGVRTAILSNMPVDVREYITRCSWLPRFHTSIFSCDLRIAKPAPEIFLQTINALGIDPAETLFLDDRAENVHAAEALGLHAVVFTTLDQVARELDRRFDIPVPLIATLDKDR
jgi:putative hydrolase of the HAD superfamily